MGHKHFWSSNRPFTGSVILETSQPNQVIRYKHRGKILANITLERKENSLKYDPNHSTFVLVQYELLLIRQSRKVACVIIKRQVPFVRETIANEIQE